MPLLSLFRLRSRRDSQRQAERSSVLYGVGVSAYQLAHDGDTLAALNHERLREALHFIFFEFDKKAGHDRGFSRKNAREQRLLLYARICAYMFGGAMR